MARLNEILVGRFNRAYQKMFGIKGGPPVATLAPEIMPGHVIFSGAEERYLQGWGLFASSINQPGVAAQFSQVQWRNPVGSNVIAVIHMLTATGLVADQPLVEVFTNAVDLGTIVALTVSRMDPRGNPQPTLICSRGSSAAQPVNPMFQRSYAGGTTVDFIPTDVDEIPLLPGDKIIISGNVLNQTIIPSMMWRERFLEEGERT
jgi:hypothetical protein